MISLPLKKIFNAYRYENIVKIIYYSGGSRAPWGGGRETPEIFLIDELLFFAHALRNFKKFPTGGLENFPN